MDLVLARLLEAVAFVLGQLLTLYGLILFIRVVASWLNADPRNGLVMFLRGATEPLLYRIRRYLPFVVMGGIDLSPLVALLGISLVRIMVVGSLQQLALQIGSASATLMHAG